MPCRYVLSLLARKGTVVYAESHFDGRFAYFNKRHGSQVLRTAYGVAYGHVFKTGNADDVSRFRAFDRLAAQTVDLKYSHYFPLLRRRVGLIEIDKRNGVAYPHGTSFYPADGYSSHVIVVVYGRNKHLKGSLLVDRLRFEMIDYCFKQGLQIGSGLIGRKGGGPRAAGTEYHRTVELLVCCIKL